MFSAWKKQTRILKEQTLALYYAYRHPGTPWYARLWVIFIVAYAFSPIDLVPDFIPILGYLDDLVLIPLGVAVAIRLVPPAVMAECRAMAVARLDDIRPRFRLMTAVIILVWLVLIAWLAWTVFTLAKARLGQPIPAGVRLAELVIRYLAALPAAESFEVRIIEGTY